MPKVLPLSRTERKKKEFEKWIRGKRSAERVTLEKLGEEMGITQQAAGAKIRKSQYSFEDLLVLFQSVNATDEEILKMMRL